MTNTRRASVPALAVPATVAHAAEPVLAGRVLTPVTAAVAQPVATTATTVATAVVPAPTGLPTPSTATASTHLTTAVPLPELPMPPPVPSLPLPNGGSIPMPESSPDPEANGPAERRVWTAEEDVQIAALVAEHGTRSWSVIAARLPTRTGKQCRERWHNHLDPGINKSEWTLEEDRKLLEAHEVMGNKWAEIAKVLPGRTDNQIKNRWNSALRRELRKLNRLANKQKGAVASAMAAATAAAAAVGGASDTGSGNGMSDTAALAAAREPLGAVLKELTNPSNPASTGGSPKAANAANTQANLKGEDSDGDEKGASPGMGHKPTKPCKKKASLQMTATALQAATEAQETLLDASQPLPHGVTEEDQANAKVLLQHMAELNSAWAAIDNETGGDASTAEARKMSKLHEHMDWLQSFCTTLVEKSLMCRNEPKAKDEPKKRRRKSTASSSKADAEDDDAETHETKRTRRRGGGGKKRGKKTVAGEEEEEEEQAAATTTGDMTVADLLEMAGASRGLHGLAAGASTGTSPKQQPLLTLPPHLASQLASPLAIYDSDFAPGSGCLSSPRHFLSPRTVEQLHSEGGLSSGDLRLSSHSHGSHPSARARDEGEEAAAACLSARMDHSALPSATAAGESSSSSSAVPKPLASTVSGAAPPAATTTLNSGSGPRSAADVAVAVYEALGGLATLAAAAPRRAAGKRSRDNTCEPGSVADDEAEMEPGYEGAGVSERRKPAGLGNLFLPNANGASAIAGPRPSPRALPVSAGSSAAGSVSHSSVDESVVFSSSTAGENGGCTSAVGTGCMSMPGTARSIELAALVSPALGALGWNGNPLSAIGNQYSPHPALALPAPSPTANLPRPLTAQVCSPKRLRGEGVTSPLATVSSPNGEAQSAAFVAAC